MDALEEPPAQNLMPDEGTEMLRLRLRTALLLCLPPIALLAVFDLYLVAPGWLAYIYSLKLAALTVALTASQFPAGHAGAAR